MLEFLKCKSIDKLKKIFKNIKFKDEDLFWSGEQNWNEGCNYDNFLINSLFCEYAYVVNLNNNTLEYYEGFQHEPQIGNRYGQEPYVTRTGEKYYPCALRGIFSLDLVKKMTSDELIQMMENTQAHNDVSQYRTENINPGTMPVGCIDAARNMIALSNHINIIARDLMIIPTLPKKKVDAINAECDKISSAIEKIKTQI